MPGNRSTSGRSRDRSAYRSRWRRLSGAMVRSVAVAALLGATLALAASAHAASRAGRIHIEYRDPDNPAHAEMAATLKKVHVLEYVRDLLDTIRLPRRLDVRLASCEGVSNAYFANDELRVCWEYVAAIYKNAATGELPIGISRNDTIVGPLLDVFLHESGHAVFNYLDLPIFGREEDAADQFSSIIMLRYDKERARRLILGSAYQYRLALKDPTLSLNVTKFSDEHGFPAQRFYNVLCIAYGFDPKLFADLVEKQYLPPVRAAGCEDEYRQVDKAFRKLIRPHVDRAAARKVLKRRGKASDAL